MPLIARRAWQPPEREHTSVDWPSIIIAAAILGALVVAVVAVVVWGV